MKRFRSHLLMLVALASLAIFAWPPIHQSLEYHRFVDTRTIFGVPNFWNVASNLPFVLVGLAGLAWMARHVTKVDRCLRAAWLVLFVGVVLVGLGSSWYHLAPGNATLVWDRLPMTLAFMLASNFTPGFKSALLHKDLRIVREMANEAGVRTDVIEQSLKDYGELIANGFGEEDTSALIRLKRTRK